MLGTKRRLGTIALTVATLLVATSCGARAGMPQEQRRECRRLRAKAAMAGVGITVGMAVVATALVVVAAATRGNVGSGSGGRRRRERRRERRQHRHEVCHQLTHEMPAPAEREAEPIAAVAPAPAPAAVSDATGEPPSEDVLVATFQGIEPEVRECLGVGGVVQIDLAIDGPTGRATGYAVHGMTPTDQQGRCLGQQLARLRFHPFQDELRVRLAVDRSWVPPPPDSDAP